MNILGINAYHGDSSAVLVRDGKLVAAIEEERIARVKHWAGFPAESIRYCLNEGQISIQQVDHIAINRDPKANFFEKALFAFSKRPSLKLVADRLKNASKVRDIKSVLCSEFNVREREITAKIHNVEHHLAHLASAFFVSPFQDSVVVSVDGFGDFVGAMWGLGQGNKLKAKERIFFPHSLGLFYLAITQYLGFPKYGDEYKVMGLAGLGQANQMDQMRKIARLDSNGKFDLGLQYFIHHSEGVTMTWEEGEPKMGSVFSPDMEQLLGNSRQPNDTIEKRHKDIACSLQAMYEEAFFNLLNSVYENTRNPKLCLAGGCAMNSVANGKIFDETPFEDVYIQSAAGDAGGALGAAYYVWNQILDKPRGFVMETAYWGPQFSESELHKALDKKQEELKRLNVTVENISNTGELCENTAREIADGKVVGWFQGRMEWGPRALGNRSILVDPRRAEMKEVLNARIKRREDFRPFAPSILLEKVGDYFEEDYPDPFMTKVYRIRPDKQTEIPAVTHVDGTGRLQTVRKADNPLYWQLIKEFESQTGVPVLLNTSFNENEPIVCRPEEALDCFLRTKMDILVLGKTIIRRE